MTEAFGIAASALSVIGFAGQILQGCQSVVTFLDQIKDAPDDFRCFRTEVRIFQSLLKSYRDALYEVEDSNDHDLWEQSMLVLAFSDEAVSGLQKLIKKYERITAPWRSIGLAFQTVKLEKHLGRVNRAKETLIASRTNKTLSVNPLNDNEYHLLTNYSLQGYRVSRFVEDAKMKLSRIDSNVSATERILSNILAQFKDLRVMSEETRDVVVDSTDKISSKMDHRLIWLRDMVENTLRRLLLESCVEAMGRPFDGTVARCSAAESPHDHNVQTDQKLSNSGNGVSTRTVFRRKGNQRRFETWFGIVSILSTSSNLVENTSIRSLLHQPSTVISTRANVVVSFSPCFTGFGIYCSIVRQTMGSAHPELDMKLRLYNTVRKTSFVIQACEEGDISKMQTLFARGQASPFDRLDGEMSLLDLVLSKIIVLPMRRDPSKSLVALKNYCRMFKFLIEQNLDPGQLWTNSKSGIAPLQFLATFSYYTSPEFTPLLLDLVRTIIQHSIQDPYSQADFTEALNFLTSITGNTPGSVTKLILDPEHWVVDLHYTDGIYQSNRPNNDILVCCSVFKDWLDKFAEHKEAIAAITYCYFRVRAVLKNSSLKGAAEAFDQNIRQHLIVSLEAGLDPLLQSGEHSLVSCLRQGDQLYVLRSALEHLKWSKDQISDLLEADLLASLAYQLAHLHIKGPKNQDHSTLRYRHIGSGDWHSYIENLNPNDYMPLSLLGPLGNRTEPSATKFQPNDNEVVEDAALRIRSAWQISINVIRDILGFLV
jgi:hypothetical protein